VALIFELHQRPEEVWHEPWIERLLLQLRGACDLLEAEPEGVDRWLIGEHMMHPDVAPGVAWAFIQARWPDELPAGTYPLLSAFPAHAECQESFARYSFWSRARTEKGLFLGRLV